MARRAESDAHWHLKQASLAWAAGQHYSVRACEIRLPHSGYRADVVAYRPAPAKGRAMEIGQTAVFECKQARADFLKDAQSAEPSLDRLRQLRQRRARIEQLLGRHYPSLRTGDSLFPEYEGIDMSDREHRTWRRVTREIRILENRVHGKTKFEKLIRYQSANLFYLVIPEGLIEAHEVPVAWGVLTADGCRLQGRCEDESPPVLRLIKKPQWIEAPPLARLDLVQRIAASATRRVNEALGLELAGGNKGPYSRLQTRPSCESKASAAPGPQEPAG